MDYCKWVDENAYKPDVDKDDLFDALYQIVNSIAIKNKMLPSWQDYRPFALYASGRLYMRLTHPRQYLSPDSGKQLKKIKSILNFLNKTMRPMIIDYQNQNFGQTINPEVHSSTAEEVRDGFIKKVINQNKDLLKVDFEYYLNRIKNTVKDLIKKTPYGNDAVMVQRLYVSCMLSLLNQITLCNANKERLKRRYESRFKTEDFLNRVYEEERQYSITLYHLDCSMYNYVATLVGRITSEIVKDLKDLIGDSEPSDAVIQSLLADQLEVLYAEE